MTTTHQNRTWVSWNGSKVAHAADGMVRSSSDIRVGGFPLACGRWAPDGWDKDIEISYKGRCHRCVKAISE